MSSQSFLTFCVLVLLRVTFIGANQYNDLVMRSDDGFSCNTDTSTLCSIKNNVVQGLNTLEVLYYGMLNTSLPDSTSYTGVGDFHDNIICISHSSGPTIQIGASAGVSAGGANAGVSVEFNVTIPVSDSGNVCIFPQDGNITLGEAKPLIDQLINLAQCHTCGNININYDKTNHTDTSGGQLKVDYRKGDNCIDKCIGPFQYRNTSATPTPTPSHSAGNRIAVNPLGGGIADWVATLLPTVVAFVGSSVLVLTLK